MLAKQLLKQAVRSMVPRSQSPGWRFSTPSFAGHAGQTHDISLAIWGGQERLEKIEFKVEWKIRFDDLHDKSTPITAFAVRQKREFVLNLAMPELDGTYELSARPYDSRLGPAQQCVVQVSTDPNSDINYVAGYSSADLNTDFWTMSGPATREQFEMLSRAKKQLLEWWDFTPRSRLLDVGCGTGQVPAVLGGYFTDGGGYTGTDIGREAVDFCRKHYTDPQFQFVHCSPTRLPLPDGEHTMACLFSVLTHTYPDETVLLLDEVRRCLVPGSPVLADVFVADAADRYSGHRGKMIHNSELFLRLATLAGFRQHREVQVVPDRPGIFRKLYRLASA
jgi:SAM-dependent methyltransferase